MFTQVPDLNDILRYKNAGVITRFKINYPADADRAEDLFTDMLRYLWLCEKHAEDCRNNPENPDFQFIPVMHEEMRTIDHMWHEFILMTKDYHAFCDHYFGHYIHHQPNMRESLAFSESEYIESLNLFLNYVYETLGEEVLTSWFQAHLHEVA